MTDSIELGAMGWLPDLQSPGSFRQLLVVDAPDGGSFPVIVEQGSKEERWSVQVRPFGGNQYKGHLVKQFSLLWTTDEEVTWEAPPRRRAPWRLVSRYLSLVLMSLAVSHLHKEPWTADDERLLYAVHEYLRKGAER